MGYVNVLLSAEWDLRPALCGWNVAAMWYTITVDIVDYHFGTVSPHSTL